MTEDEWKEKRIQELEQELKKRDSYIKSLGNICDNLSTEKIKVVEDVESRREQIKQLEEELNTKDALAGLYLKSTDEIAELRQERDALKAHCETLCNDLRDAMEWNWVDWGAPRQMSIDKTPTQSLAEIQAQAIETMIDSMDWSKGIAPENCYEHAKQIREGITE